MVCGPVFCGAAALRAEVATYEGQLEVERRAHAATKAAAASRERDLEEQLGSSRWVHTTVLYCAIKSRIVVTLLYCSVLRSAHIWYCSRWHGCSTQHPAAKCMKHARHCTVLRHRALVARV